MTSPTAPRVRPSRLRHGPGAVMLAACLGACGPSITIDDDGTSGSGSAGSTTGTDDASDTTGRRPDPTGMVSTTTTTADDTTSAGPPSDVPIPPPPVCSFGRPLLLGDGCDPPPLGPGQELDSVCVSLPPGTLDCAACGDACLPLDPVDGWLDCGGCFAQNAQAVCGPYPDDTPGVCCWLIVDDGFACAE